MNNPGLEREAEIASTPAAVPTDVATIDAIIHAAYDVISGPAGQARDWNRERSLFPEKYLTTVERRTAG